MYNAHIEKTIDNLGVPKMKTEPDGTREYMPIPKTMGELHKLAERWAHQYGTMKEIEIVKTGDVLFLSPKP